MKTIDLVSEFSYYLLMDKYVKKENADWTGMEPEILQMKAISTEFK
jgi:hypothetical protein